MFSQLFTSNVKEHKQKNVGEKSEAQNMHFEQHPKTLQHAFEVLFMHYLCR